MNITRRTLVAMKRAGVELPKEKWEAIGKLLEHFFTLMKEDGIKEERKRWTEAQDLRKIGG